MKKYRIAICLLVVCMLSAFTSCDFLSGSTDSGTKETKKTAETEEPAEEEEEEKEETNEYKILAENLKKSVSEAETLDDYLDAVLQAVKDIPKDDITNAAGKVAGNDAVEKVNDYYDQVYVALSVVQAFDISDILSNIDENGDIINKIGGFIGSLIGKDISVSKNEDGSYSALGLTLFVGTEENADESYRVTTQAGDTYDIAYFQTTRYLTVSVEKSGTVTTKVDCRLVEDDIYAQYHATAGSLFQTHIDTEKLQATVSLQESTATADDLSSAVPSDFATKGQTYVLNKDLLK